LRLPSGRLRCRSGRLSLTDAGDRAAARAARPVAGSRAVERQAELIGQGRQPGEDVADLVELLVARALADGPGQLAELLREPGDRRVDAAAAVARTEGAGHQFLELVELHHRSLARSADRLCARYEGSSRKG